MAEQLRRQRARFSITLGAISLGGLLLRVGYVLAERYRELPIDGGYYRFAAGALADGEGFIHPFSGAPIALHPPGWPIALAPLPLLGFESALAHQLVACAIGALSIVLVALAGRAFGGPRAGLIAGGIVAVHPGLWVYERALLSEVLVVPIIAAMVLVAASHLRSPGLRTACALGVLCGIGTLVRSELLAFVPLLLIPVVLAAGRTSVDVRRRALWGVAGTAVAVVTILPWVAYNAGRFENPVLLTTNFGPTARLANCPQTYSGERIGHIDDGCRYVGLDPIAGDETDIDAELRRRAVRFAMDNLDRVPIVIAAREGRTWGVFRPFQQARFDAEFGNDPLWVHRAAFLAHWVLIPFVVVGGVTMRRRHGLLFILLSLVAVVSIATAVTLGQPRVRLPADIGIAVLAAVGIDALVRRSRPRSPETADGQVELQGLTFEGGPPRVP